jgi:toxin CcdB
MARFDLYSNPDDETQRLAPYLLDVQSTHVGILPTRIVIPLRPTQSLAFSGTPSGLLPIFEINGDKHFLDTPAMSAIPLNALGGRVGSSRISATPSTLRLTVSSVPTDQAGTIQPSSRRRYLSTENVRKPVDIMRTYRPGH